MLRAISIRNVVLIESLDLEFGAGLSVFSGETGAGKSILLGSLGLVLGERADLSLVRLGTRQATVTAVFDDLSPDTTAILDDYGIEPEDQDSGLIIKRVIGADGRSKAFINGEPVSVASLRALGQCLAEVHGQFESQSLLNPATHRGLLDAYGGLGAQLDGVAGAWKDWRAAEKAVTHAREQHELACREEEYLRHAAAEIGALAPQPGEESELSENRTMMMNSEKIIEAVDGATKDLNHGRGVGYALQNAAKQLARLAEKVEGQFEPIITALDRASADVDEATSMLDRLTADMDMDQANLEQVEERLFTLRAQARKHQVSVDDLAALYQDFERQLASIVDGGAEVFRLQQVASAAQDKYSKAAQALSALRAKFANTMGLAVCGELEPLKLGKATFLVSVETLDEAAWGEHGMDRVTFLVATNPGSKPGPIGKIASGGELARFVLALKVILSRADPVSTLVFDEVDSGIGGATAAAVGERLSALARDIQVLVVTHSPQVAAMGSQHWRVHKAQHSTGQEVTTKVDALSASQRREEIARMLSGATITDEARAAAMQLLDSDIPLIADGSAA